MVGIGIYRVVVQRFGVHNSLYVKVKKEIRRTPYKLPGPMPMMMIGRSRRGIYTQMQILDSLYGAATENLGRALKRTGERHGMITNNIANVNTPGYKRQDIDFGIALRGEENRLERKGPSAIQDGGGSQRLDGNSVNMEQEMGALAMTEFRYQLLTDMTGKYFRGLTNVIREGR